MTAVVDIPAFYEGIWVDDVHLGGLAVEEAKQVLMEKGQGKAWRRSGLSLYIMTSGGY
jgi:hypothetical protein